MQSSVPQVFGRTEGQGLGASDWKWPGCAREGHVNGDVRYYSELIRAYSGLFRQHGDNAPKARVFISYSHADDELRKGLEKHLAALRNQRVIEV